MAGTATSPTASRFLRLANEMPGASLSALARALGVDPSTAAYHARRLCHEGHVVLVRGGRELCAFPANAGYCPWQRRALPLLRAASARRLAAEIVHEPATLPEVALRARVSIAAARWALRQLRRLDAIEACHGQWRVVPSRRACLARALAGLPCGRCDEALAAPVGAAGIRKRPEPLFDPRGVGPSPIDLPARLAAPEFRDPPQDGFGNRVLDRGSVDLVEDPVARRAAGQEAILPNPERKTRHDLGQLLARIQRPHEEATAAGPARKRRVPRQQHAVLRRGLREQRLVGAVLGVGGVLAQKPQPPRQGAEHLVAQEPHALTAARDA
ncbi:MAG TPA: hypothetical protein VM681_10395 [Candidatus Thermoplasmatota archaeon]|nr:hypothetical protein [Candidatus Thermoplasmatota archaeon]